MMEKNINNDINSSSVKHVNRSKNKEKDTGEWFQILAIFIGCIPSFTFGQFFCWPSPSIPKIINDNSTYNISLEEASYFPVLPQLGVVVSCLIFAKLNDTIGRKYTLLLAAIPQIIAWILIGLAKSVYVFYISRFLGGFGDACLYASLPMYIGEVASPRVRGTWGNSLIIVCYFGQFVITVIGSYLDISTTAYICIIFPIIFLVAFSFMPESPYYLMMKNKDDKARKALEMFKGKTDVDDDLAKLKKDVERQMSETGTWKDLFTIVSNRKAVYAGFFLRISQQMSGISCVMVYTQYIFAKSGSQLSAETSSIIVVGLSVIVTFCASFGTDKFGRRHTYITSISLCGILNILLAIYLYLEEFHREIDMDFLSWLPMVMIVSYIVAYDIGASIIPTLMMSELFSVSIKGKALCLMNISFAVMVSSTTKVFNVLETNFGMFSAFLFYGCCSFVAAVLSFYLVPETKGKTLEQIQQTLKGGGK